MKKLYFIDLITLDKWMASSKKSFLPTENGFVRGQIDLNLISGLRVEVVLLEGLLLATQLRLFRGRRGRQDKVEGALNGQKVPQVSGLAVDALPDVDEQTIGWRAVAERRAVEIFEMKRKH